MDEPPPAKTYSEPYAAGGKWRYRLTPEGKAAAAAYLAKYPSPMGFLRKAAPHLHAAARADGNTREEVEADMRAAVARAYIHYDPAFGPPEAYVRKEVLGAACRALGRAAPQDAAPQADDGEPGYDRAAPSGAAPHPFHTGEVFARVRASCDELEWAVLWGYYGFEAPGEPKGAGDGTGKHVPELAEAMGLDPGEYELILKGVLRRLRAELADVLSEG